MGQSKKLSRWDVIKSFWLWMFFSHSCYNYERLQAGAVAQYMAPILKKLYTSKEDISAGLKRHLTFFNTEPNVGAIIHGITIAMEEEKANGVPITDEGINAIKTGLMGPMAGIGDTITQGIITPILLALGISLAKEGNLAGPVIYTALISACIIGIAYFGWMQGYIQGRKAVEKILEGGLINTVITGAGVMGCMVLGALTGQFVSLSTPVVLTVGQTAIKLQADILDKIVPKVLALLLTLGVLYLVRKGKSPVTVMIYIVLAGLIGGLIGLF
ncbi:PTS system mannose/fructose/sorbose family transporter subunit IID [Biomaibacter acetigenes]|jgi:PTS system mannose-specific IID component|uniref:PTS system mannose/fructose/sorbose family transporter subunit IID n=1 Tax=Biomaibacter acetigenes TaxID=2316383 RepID=A0A3G2R7B1_9FIRM|nr:PTS system mannose/fructose/sorbose family transporter subunit IID [Biomaibacter acetigenes]AYO31321.1 PTS system mannose/fructose/sorbose family transporter subunit IID [Biomaibacter acetigenes]MDN5311240.1 mannose system component [Thermoanaerobacteraceae bacterium]